MQQIIFRVESVPVARIRGVWQLDCRRGFHWG